jgi:hypothetical protein
MEDFGRQKGIRRRAFLTWRDAPSGAFASDRVSFE